MTCLGDSTRPPDEQEMLALLFIRVALLLLMVGAALYVLNEEVESWCTDTYDRYQSKYDRLVNNLTDTDFTIPELQRRPPVSMTEFYATRDQTLTNMMMATRLRFQQQNHMGTVMRDGFHADLPDNAVWRGGVIVMGENIRTEVQKAAVKPSPPK